MAETASTSPDGAYECQGTQGDGSCDEPIGTLTWSLSLSGDDATIRIDNAGVQATDLSPNIVCAGQWTGDRFDCSTFRWLRAGRQCMAEMHLRLQPPDSLSFWTGAADETRVVDRAACTRLP